MKASELKTEILAAVSEELDTWFENQSKIKDGYEYETKYMQFVQKINKLILEKSMGQLPGSRNKKNSHMFWKNNDKQSTSIKPAYF